MTKYFEQRLDHFNAAEGRTFQQRYLYSGEKWDGKGPLFVYTGNEGDITWFYNNTVSINLVHISFEIPRVARKRPQKIARS